MKFRKLFIEAGHKSQPPVSYGKDDVKRMERLINLRRSRPECRADSCVACRRGTLQVVFEDGYLREADAEQSPGNSNIPGKGCADEAHELHESDLTGQTVSITKEIKKISKQIEKENESDDEPEDSDSGAGGSDADDSDEDGDDTSGAGDEPGDADDEGADSGSGDNAGDDAGADGKSDAGDEADDGDGDDDESHDADVGGGGNKAGHGDENNFPGDGNVPSPVEIRNMLEQALSEIESDEGFQKDVSDMVKSISARIDGADVGQEYKKFTLSTVPEEVAAVSQRIVREMGMLHTDVEPEHVRDEPNGMVDVSRIIRRKADPTLTDVFVKWDEGHEDDAKTEVVVAIDLSGSMDHNMRNASLALWIIKSALDKCDIPCTVLGFSDWNVILYKPWEKLNGTTFKYFSSWAGTRPERNTQAGASHSGQLASEQQILHDHHRRSVG